MKHDIPEQLPGVETPEPLIDEAIDGTDIISQAIVGESTTDSETATVSLALGSSYSSAEPRGIRVGFAVNSVN